MIIVVDANIIIMGLMGSRAALVIITSQQHHFYAPTKIVREIKKHNYLICDKINISTSEFEENLKSLLKFITIVEPQEYRGYMSMAQKSMEQRDNNDIEYVACALAVCADFIWTQDADFVQQTLIPTRTTAQFIEEQKNN